MRRRAGIGSHELPVQGRTDVWLTPRRVIDALGPFDLDPCAANPRPFDCARENIAFPNDGLAAAWFGRVWLNPPYGPVVGKWLSKLAQHGDGIALVFARTETPAMQSAMRRSSAIMFIAGRLTFLSGNPPHRPGRGNSGGPSMFLAYGDRNVDALRTLEVGSGLLYFRDTEDDEIADAHPELLFGESA